MQENIKNMNLIIKTVRWIKNHSVSSDVVYRKIRFGVAKGLYLPICRRFNLRMELGLFERPISRYIKEFSRGSHVAYDLGAAEGYYVLVFAKYLGKEGKIFPEARHSVPENSWLVAY